METLLVHTLIPQTLLHPHQPKLRVHIDSEPVNRFINSDISPHFVHEKSSAFIISLSLLPNEKKKAVCGEDSGGG